MCVCRTPRANVSALWVVLYLVDCLPFGEHRQSSDVNQSAAAVCCGNTTRTVCVIWRVAL
jgi:hypothetical protein